MCSSDWVRKEGLGGRGHSVTMSVLLMNSFVCMRLSCSFRQSFISASSSDAESFLGSSEGVLWTTASFSLISRSLCLETTSAAMIKSGLMSVLASSCPPEIERRVDISSLTSTSDLDVKG